MTARDAQVAALRDIADGLNAGLPGIHAVTVGGGPIRVQVIGDLAENVDRWLQFFDPAAKGAVTERNWGSRGQDFYSGEVVLEEGATLVFWDAIPASEAEDLKAENERLRAELAALRGEDVVPPAGDAVATEVAAEVATAPVDDEPETDPAALDGLGVAVTGADEVALSEPEPTPGSTWEHRNFKRHGLVLEVTDDEVVVKQAKRTTRNVRSSWHRYWKFVSAEAAEPTPVEPDVDGDLIAPDGGEPT